MAAKKVLAKGQNNSLCQTNMSPVCICEVLIEKHCLVKHFAFLKNVCYQYLSFVLRVTYCFFLQAADHNQLSWNVLLFPVIRLVNFVYVAPVTVVAL